MAAAALAGRDAADDARAVVEHAADVERGGTPGQALHDHTRFATNEDSHEGRSFLADATAFCTASHGELPAM